MENFIRLDLFLLKNKNIKSRNKAKELIQNGKILVNNKLILKSSFLVNYNDTIEILENKFYVSRAALKLKYALLKWNIDLNNKVILDIGSSTGGFIQVCLENKAKKIYGIEVGQNQLDSILFNNPKILYFEKTNFKNVNKNLFRDNIDFITCDVSFISSKKIILKILELFNNKIGAIFLLKPQFELDNKRNVNNFKGFIGNDLVHKKIINDYKEFLYKENVKFIDIIRSPIKGAKSGNIEFLILLEFNYEE